MRVVIEAEPKGIAALVVGLQGQQHGFEPALKLDAKAVARAICDTGLEVQRNT